MIRGLIRQVQFLKLGDKLIVISFHSIEDKIVKFFFKKFSKEKSRSSRYYPDSFKEKILFENYRNKVIRPSNKEITVNKPSRSAKLRFAIRSKDDFFYPLDLKNKFLNYLELENKNV